MWISLEFRTGGQVRRVPSVGTLELGMGTQRRGLCSGDDVLEELTLRSVCPCWPSVCLFTPHFAVCLSTLSPRLSVPLTLLSVCPHSPLGCMSLSSPGCLPTLSPWMSVPTQLNLWSFVPLTPWVSVYSEPLGVCPSHLSAVSPHLPCGLSIPLTPWLSVHTHPTLFLSPLRSLEWQETQDPLKHHLHDNKEDGEFW